jgi:hypothetical protein
LQNFAGGATGGSADTGDVWNATQQVNNVVFADNFFSDEGLQPSPVQMLKPGLEQANLQLAI